MNSRDDGQGAVDVGDGKEKSAEKAAEWFLRAAEKGNAAAMFNMSWCNKIGDGVEKSAEKAVEWLTRAAEKGEASQPGSRTATASRRRPRRRPSGRSALLSGSAVCVCRRSRETTEPIAVFKRKKAKE